MGGGGKKWKTSFSLRKLRKKTEKWQKIECFTIYEAKNQRDYDKPQHAK